MPDKFSFRENNFDLLRLLAAFQVAFVHFVEHLKIEIYEPLFTLIKSVPGVPIFFVISGFLISAAYQRSPDIRNYYQNRLLRIYPALWVCLAVSILSVILIAPPESVGIKEGIAWLIAQISIGQFYNPDFLRYYGLGALNGSLWTIPVELQFYLALPVIFLALRKLNNTNISLIICMIALIAFNQFFIEAIKPLDTTINKLIGVSLLPYLYFFLLGMLMQQNLAFVEKALKNKWYIWLVVFITLSTITKHFGLPVTGNSINPLSSMALCFLTISLAYSNTRMFSNLLRGNDISYGLYIYHGVVLNALIESRWLDGWLGMTTGLAASILLAIFSWRIVEKPALRLKRNSIHRV